MVIPYQDTKGHFSRQLLLKISRESTWKKDVYDAAVWCCQTQLLASAIFSLFSPGGTLGCRRGQVTHQNHGAFQRQLERKRNTRQSTPHPSTFLDEMVWIGTQECSRAKAVTEGTPDRIWLWVWRVYFQNIFLLFGILEGWMSSSIAFLVFYFPFGTPLHTCLPYFFFTRFLKAHLNCMIRYNNIKDLSLLWKTFFADISSSPFLASFGSNGTTLNFHRRDQRDVWKLSQRRGTPKLSWNRSISFAGKKLKSCILLLQGWMNLCWILWFGWLN